MFKTGIRHDNQRLQYFFLSQMKYAKIDWDDSREDSLEKEMATHSSILAWEIPWTEKPGRLQSMGSHRVGHD